MERKEAIEVVKKNYPHCAESGTQFETALRTLIPELCESEDERIRKWIKKELENKYVDDGIINNVLADKALAWLEGQKPSDAALEYLKENHSPSEVSDFQAAMNIAVAKAYDRGRADAIGNDSYLQEKIAAFTAAHKGEDPEDIIAACRGDERQGEQKQDPCRTCDHPVLSCSAFPCEKKKQAEQKPTEWSEEDEIAINAITQLMKTNEKYNVWKSVYMDNGNVEVKFEYIASWLKSIKGRLQQQPKQEWSEEDEMISLSVEQVFNCASLLDIVPDKIEKVKDWLKSLKERYTWKPSEEQMWALERCVDYLEESDNEDAEKIESLHNDLKKLKEDKL